jgi:CheY-like chemotaxis protein/two-component sensor histidine kinase
MTRLVDDLMDVSRITQGRMQLRRAPVELAAVVRSAAHDMGAMMEAARHTLRLSIAEAPVMVEGDATRLAQVVINLLTNAAKYTPDGGLIELELACHPEAAEIRVRDNGIGIPASSLATVFQMFSQLEPALERAKGGLGIGLALVRGIVALHGGSIHADSAGPDKGSEFTVRLPLAASAACPGAEEADHALPARGRVLVVDDNKDAAETLTMALQLSGCETLVVHTAGAALEAAAAFQPTAALLDIGLPDMNGYELARRLRQGPHGADVVLIAITGWGQEKDRQRAFDAGFDHHLTKPIDFDQLRPLLARAAPARG